MERTPAVVPPREGLPLRQHDALGVDHPEGGQRGDRLPLGHGDVRRTLREGREVPDVLILGGDVEVPRHHGRPHSDELGQTLTHRREELELARVPLARDLTSVGDVDRDHAHPADGRFDPASLIRDGTARQVPDRVDQLDTGGDEQRHPVPPSLRGLHSGVPDLGQRIVGEGLGGELRLLEAEHIRAVRLQDLGHTRPARLERVDVPGDESHAGDRSRDGASVLGHRPRTDVPPGPSGPTPPCEDV